MREFSFTQLSRDSSEVTAIADHEPVALTHDRTPKYVLMSYEGFQVMSARLADSRRVYSADDTPDDVAEWLVPPLDRFAEGEDAING